MIHMANGKACAPSTNATSTDTELTPGLFSSDKLINLILKEDALSSTDVQNPLLAEVLKEVVSDSLNNLPRELSQARLAQQRLQTQIEELAAEHYPVFLAKAEASQSVLQNISGIVSLNERLMSKLPCLTDSSKNFLSKAHDVGDALQLNSKALDRHTQLLELLELPQLMETCVHNGYLDDAIAILTFAKKLATKHGPSLPAVRAIGAEAHVVGRQLVHHLCNQLRAPISLPACIKVVVFLRRTGVFSEHELRLKFLQARNTCLETQLSNSLSAPRIGESGHKNTNELKGGFRSLSNRTAYEAYWRATRRIEVTRVQLFDIVTQYRTIFTEEESLMHRGLRATGNAPPQLAGMFGQFSASPLCFSSTESHEDRPQRTGYSLFHAWLIYRVTIFLETISSDVDQMLYQPCCNVQEVLDRWSLSSTSGIGTTGTSEPDMEALFTQLQSLISQTMYFGRSFMRIGCDFRPHLVDVFNNAILSYVQVYVNNSIMEYTIALEHLLWKISDAALSKNTVGNQSMTHDVSNELHSVAEPDQLLCYPPLVLLYNRFTELYNGLRVCCPLGLKSRLITLIYTGLRLAASRLVSAYRASVDHQTVNWRSDATSMATAFGQVLVPILLDGLLNRLFGDHTEPEKGQASTTLIMQRLKKHICVPLDGCFQRPSSAKNHLTNGGFIDYLGLSEKSQSDERQTIPSATSQDINENGSQTAT